MATRSVADMELRALDIVARPAGAPAGEHNVGALQRYWEAANGLTEWEDLVAFIFAAVPGVNNFGDAWLAYWDARD